MNDSASSGTPESSSTGKRPSGSDPVMSASRLRDLVATYLRSREDVYDVELYPSAYSDRLGMTVTDTDSAQWRMHFLRDPWFRPGDIE